MPSENKIVTLMRICRLNNVTLARGIDADPSLVSRWRGGERSPTRESAADIAQFVSGMTLFDRDRALLSEVVGLDCSTREATAEALLLYLTDREPTAAEREERRQRDWTELASALLSPPPLSVYKPGWLPGGTIGRHDVFAGVKGRRRALLLFLRKPARPAVLTLCFADGLDWLTGGEEPGEVAEALWEALRKGHRLHICLPEPERTLPAWMEAGFPFAAGLSVYPVPDGEPPGFWVSAEGVGALLSGGGAGGATVLLPDAEGFCAQSGLLGGHLPAGRAAATGYDGAGDCTKRLLELQAAEGLFISARDTLPAFFLPAEVWEGMIADDTRLDDTLALMSRQRESFTRHAQTDGWVGLFPLALLDAMALNESCVVRPYELPGFGEFTLAGAALRATLQTMRACIEAYPKCSFIWAERLPPPYFDRAADEELLCFLPLGGHIRGAGLTLPAWLDSLPEAWLRPDFAGNRGAAALDEVLELLALH